jgi:hypothetical protein
MTKERYLVALLKAASCCLIHLFPETALLHAPVFKLKLEVYIPAVFRLSLSLKVKRRQYGPDVFPMLVMHW